MFDKCLIAEMLSTPPLPRVDLHQVTEHYSNRKLISMDLKISYIA
ncbi:hypothetical protein C3B79_2558 [Aeromonas hydrophila]|nr:hypothetical protein C3B79_2558 [Aeromonas hydrophila]